MKRRTFMQSCAAGALTLAVDSPLSAQAGNPGAGTLEEAFRNPPSTAFARTWWHWMNGNISEIGITRDLEAMKRVGCSGFQIFQVGSGIAKGPVDYGSPQHIHLLQHAAREANRLGLEFAMHNCPGWSSSGGPWITPELSMQVVTWSETLVAGGRSVDVTLREPPARQNYYRDAMVLAIPSAPGEDAQPLKVTSNSGPVQPAALNGDPSAGVEVTAFLLLEYAEPVEARSVAIFGSAPPATNAGRGGGGGGGGRGFAASLGVSLEASDDGVQFRKVADLAAVPAPGRGGPLDYPLTANFAATRAKYFRVVTTGPRRVAAVRLSATPGLANFAVKANYGGSRGMGAQAAAAQAETPAGGFLQTSAVVDVTRFMDHQGRLQWQAPSGNWTVLRIGHTTTGAINSPGPDGGVGLECDKFSKEAYEFHFTQFFGKLFPVIEPLAAKGMAGAIIDSYETGLQNWTARFPQEFQKRRGYDLKPYMPAMLGRVVGSPEVSDRFLWDIRKTHAELMQEYYYGTFQEQCHKHGMKSFIEPYDPGNFDEMPTGQYADMVMGEFWLGQPNQHSIKLVSSVGHIYDKKIIGAESFTGQSKWQEHPYCMKTTGDFMYAQGLNNYVFHRYCHQPHPDVAPGMTMGPWGWFFDRTNTWFEKSPGWLKGYVARAQNMLRQGAFVGDLLYFTGEDSPQVSPAEAQLKPPPPAGYDWDTIDAGAILTRVKIENGRIVLPNGIHYRVMVLRENARLSLALLRKIRDLVDDGMVLVVNSKPSQIPGLTNYPASDTEVRQIASEMWGDLDGVRHTTRHVGKGRIFWGEPMPELLAQLGVAPDLEFTAKSADAPIHWIHRRVGDAEVYFIANRRRQSEDLVCTFRVNGKQPEFWDAATGEIAKVATYEEADGRTRVPLRLDPAGSIFVVFRAPSPSRRIQQISRDGTMVATTQPFAAQGPGLHRNVTNNFTISLWMKPDMDLTLPAAGGPGAGLGGGGGTNAPTFLFYPPAAESVYGSNHAACGLAAGRNGVILYERGSGGPMQVVTARAAIAGWTHVAVVYRDGAPSVYLDGKPAGQAAKSGSVVHPGLGESHDAPMDFLGQMTAPRLVGEALDDGRIRELAATGLPAPEEPPAFEPAGAAKPELLFWRDGDYTLRDNAGRNMAMQVAGAGAPVELKGPWTVKFPPKLGAPAEITMPELQSLTSMQYHTIGLHISTVLYHIRYTCLRPNNCRILKTRRCVIKAKCY